MSLRVAVATLGLLSSVWACTGSKVAATPGRIKAASSRAQLARRAAADPAGSGELRVTVHLAAALTQIDVTICPTGFRLEHLLEPSPGARALLLAGRIITPEGDESCAAEGVDLTRLKTDECVRYSVTLPDRTPDPTALRRVGRDLLASPDLWLWEPTPRPSEAHSRVHFDLPPGMFAALPWPIIGTDYILPNTAFAWKSGGAFTHSAAQVLPVLGGELDSVTLGAGFGAQAAAVDGWLLEGARAASLLFGRFPDPRALVITVPSERSRSSFGMALRGGGPAVVLLLDSHVASAKLSGDWTATHEFLHLGVPRLPPEDAWLFEGLATYYTEIVRARAGSISGAQAYQHLLAGFERGQRQRTSRTLRTESAEMHARRAFFRVYWSGAALALLTDVASRRAGGATLDSALRAFAACCASGEQEWTAERVLARLDAALGSSRYAELAHAWLDRSDFPAVSATLLDLGVSLGPRDEALYSNGRDSRIRDEIVQKSSEPGADR